MSPRIFWRRSAPRARRRIRRPAIGSRASPRYRRCLAAMRILCNSRSLGGSLLLWTRLRNINQASARSPSTFWAAGSAAPSRRCRCSNSGLSPASAEIAGNLRLHAREMKALRRFKPQLVFSCAVHILRHTRYHFVPKSVPRFPPLQDLKATQGRSYLGHFLRQSKATGNI
jgi:hypothetical protein